jgi:predicted small secreted protein
MKKVMLSVVAVLFSLTLAGCNTISGIGKDLQSVGDMIIGGSDHVREAVKNNPPGSKMETK